MWYVPMQANDKIAATVCRDARMVGSDANARSPVLRPLEDALYTVIHYQGNVEVNLSLNTRKHPLAPEPARRSFRQRNPC